MSAHGVLAATLVEPGKYELREYPLPEPAEGCVLVKMEMSGICGTDKHTYQGFVTQYGKRRLEFPIIQGHENVGTIAEIGGDAVIPTMKACRSVSATAWWLARVFPAGNAITAGMIFRTTAVRRRRITETTSAPNIPLSFRWVVAVHLYSAGQFSRQSARRLAGGSGVADGNFRGVGRPGPRETNIGVSERVVSF